MKIGEYGEELDDHGDIVVWWHPGSPDYDEARTTAIRKLIIDNLLVKADIENDLFTGYVYDDGTKLEVMWGDYEDENGKDIAFYFDNGSFHVSFRLTVNIRVSPFEDSLWIDHVSRDDVLQGWIKKDINRQYIRSIPR